MVSLLSGRQNLNIVFDSDISLPFTDTLLRFLADPF